MTATRDIETIFTSCDLPTELMRMASSHHQGDEPQTASILSGMIAARQTDEVICPVMLRRKLVLPAHEGLMCQSGWRVE